MKGGAVGFGGGLGGPKRAPRPLPCVIDPDGVKGLVGVVGGPSEGLGGRAGSDIDGKLSEDASSDKFREVKDKKLSKLPKVRKVEEVERVTFIVRKRSPAIDGTVDRRELLKGDGGNG